MMVPKFFRCGDHVVPRAMWQRFVLAVRLAILASILVASVHAVQAQDTAPAAASTSETRVLHFPADRSLGKLEDLNRPTKPWRKYWGDRWLDSQLGPVQVLGEARGDVVAPVDARLRLTIDLQAAHSDLTPLAALPERAIDSVRFQGDSVVLGNGWEPLCALDGLRDLSLWNVAVTNDEIAQLKRAKSLERLEVANPDLNSTGIAHLAEIKSLKALRLFTVTTVTLVDFGRLATLDRLNDLQLSLQNFDPDGYEQLRDLPNLQRLYIGEAECSGRGFEHLSKLTALRYLGFYDLNGRGVAALPPLPNLKELDISYKGEAFTSQQLTSLSGFPDLEYLSIRGRVLDDGVAQIKPLKKLKMLEFHGTWQDRDWMTDEAMVHMKAIPTLEHLILYTGDFTDEGLRHISELSKLKTLEIPNSTGFTDAGLAYVGKPTQLERLNFRSELITDEGLKHLEGLKSLRSLRLFPYSKVTDEGIARLKSCLPNLVDVENRERGEPKKK